MNMELQQKIRKYEKEPIRAEEYSNGNEKFTRGNDSKVDDTEEWISDLDERVKEITQAEQKKEKRI